MIKKLIGADTRDMTADGHGTGGIKRDALRMLMDGKMNVTNECDSLEIYDKSKHDHSRSALGVGSASAHPLPGQGRVPRRPAALVLWALVFQAFVGHSIDPYMAQAGAAKSYSVVLKPTDNPFALIGIGRISMESAFNMTNAGYHKAYTKAAIKFHPDKCRGGPEARERFATLSRKSKAAEELLTIDELIQPKSLSESR